MPNSLNPADCLDGLLIANEWQVISRAPHHPSGTGGHFSIGYVVQHRVTRKKAFLKAFDFSRAFQAEDFAREVQNLSAAFNFERDLLAVCRSSNMRRVLTPIADGVHVVPDCAGPLDRAHYLIFDLAEGDIRKFISDLGAVDVAWCLRSLHHTATGIAQLHSKGIMHQDIKPSNVLTFKMAGTKISDLGRGFSPEFSARHDAFLVPGDQSYAPLELFYGVSSELDTERRKGIDIYCLGSLLIFHFLGVSASQGVVSHVRLANTPLSGTDFARDLPVLQAAFGALLEEFEATTVRLAPRPLKHADPHCP